MARIRTIKPTFWPDELVGAMSATTRLVFIGLFSLADDEGRLRGSAAFVWSQLFVYDKATTVDDVEAALLQLHAARRIRLYGNGQRYVEVLNFAKHQRIQKPQRSQLPAPGGHHPVLPIEGVSEQEIPIPVRDQSATSINGSGGEGEVSEGLRPPSSAVGRPRRAKVKPEVDPQVAACFEWYCREWGKVGPLKLELTTKRARAIDKALKAHGSAKVAAAIKGHLTNDWRHGQLNRNDITVLLRDENIDAGVELAAKAAGLTAVAGGGDDIESMGY